MDKKTKLIIVTSDEHFIEKISSNKSGNTHIIDLDNDEQVAQMIDNEKNIINLAFLAQLSTTVGIQ